MTVWHVMKDGALAAAELLVLLFAAAEPAPEPAATAAQSIEQSAPLHRFSDARDRGLLGAVAGVRSVPRLRNENEPIHDHQVVAETVDREADSVLVVSFSRRTEPPDAWPAAADCDFAAQAGHARLTEDEAIAAAMWAPPRTAHQQRVDRPNQNGGPLPTGLLVGQGDQALLLVAPNVAAASAILALRPTSASGGKFFLGAVEPGTTILVPLANRQHLQDLAAGAIELELIVNDATFWTTVIAGRADTAAPAAE